MSNLALKKSKIGILILTIFIIFGVSTWSPVKGINIVVVPIDYPSLASALAAVPDNTIIKMNIIETIPKPISVLNRKNIMITGGGLKTSSYFPYDYVLGIFNSKNITIDNFSINNYGSSIPYFTNFKGVFIVNSTFHLNKINSTLDTSLGWFGTSTSIRAALSKGFIENSVLHSDYGIQISDTQVFGRRFLIHNVTVYTRNVLINAFRVGVVISFSYFNNTVSFDNVSIYLHLWGDKGYSIFTGGPVTPVDTLYSGENRINISRGYINGKNSYKAFAGIYGREPYSDKLNIIDTIISGFYNGIYLDVGGRISRTFFGRNIHVDVDKLEVFGASYGFKLRNLGMTYDLSIRILNSIFNHSTNGGIMGIFVNTSAFERKLERPPILANFLFYLNNVNVSGFKYGIYLHLNMLHRKRIGIERYFYPDRGHFAVYLKMENMVDERTLPDPLPRYDLQEIRFHEDMYIAYSIAWIIDGYYKDRLGYVPKPSITLYETVYDEHHIHLTETIIRSIWTLETQILSSYTNSPIYGANVNYYMKGSLISSGHTWYDGTYRSILDYYVSIGYPRIDSIFDEASLGRSYASTWYISYIGDTYTMPSWYGRIILYLDFLVFKAIGFSYKLGTTYLQVYGITGDMVGFYSYTPDELNKQGRQAIYSELNGGVQKKEGLYNLPILVVGQVKGGRYILIEAKVYFNGAWQPILFMVNLNNKLIFSRGPVDFRGVLL